MPAPRLIIGNLDCEEDFAGRGRHRPTLSVAARRTVSALATLVRALAEDGDRLWTPLPVAPERMARVPGLPEPELISGPLAGAGPASEVVPWGETGPVAELRERLGLEPGPPVEAVAAANHRSFGIGVARELGFALPGTVRLRSLWALSRHLLDRPAGARWALKAPLSAAGRSRVFGEGPDLTEADERKAARLLAHHGEMIFEPWMDRVRDLGVSGRVGPEGALDLHVHGLLADEWGYFRGIAHDLDHGEGTVPARAAAHVGTRLAEAGYRGPFGVDSFTYRDADGREFANPICDVNARWTFGHLAREIRRRVAPGASSLVLRAGRGEPPDGAVPLLLPGDGDPTSAWLEIGG